MLTDEQSAIVTAAATDRQLVTAGPGTGKTHTLVARLAHLVDNQGLAPGGVLALSFSRAAVGELRRRLRSSDSEAAAIRPVTFDSFATRVLADVDPDGQWSTESFDGRIAQAIERIDDFAEFLEEIDYLCVDEVQDLVSVRMRFVRALLAKLDVGFILLGDPAQGIYDFSLADGETSEEHGSPAFYRWIRSSMADTLVESRLTINHRAKSQAAKDACALGPTVEVDPSTAGSDLFEILEDSPKIPNLSFLGNSIDSGRTAILCRNNGEALWVSKALDEIGIDHVVQRGAQNRMVAPWLARACAVSQGGIVSKAKMERLLDLLNEEVPGAAPSIDEAWRPLRQMGRADASVDLDRVVTRLRTGGVPEELLLGQSAAVTVSTVHRAKGLEFERVVVIPDGWGPSFEDEDAKTLFVALSRTIDHLMHADLPALVGYLKKHSYADRWTYTSYKSWPKAMEIVRDDVATLDPPKGDGGCVETQRLLWEEVRPGDPVELRFDRALIGSPGAIYDVVWKDKVIASMSDEFGRTLLSVIKYAKNWSYPKRITGLRVDGVRSIGGDQLVTNQLGLGTGGAWLSPSLSGLGHFEYDKKGQ